MKPYYTLADLLDEGHPFDAGESVPAKLAVIGFPIAHSKSPAMQQAALDAAGIAQVRQWAQTVVECPYPLLERVKLEIAAAQGILGEVSYGAQVRLPALLPVEHWPAYAARITELTAGKIAAEKLGETFQAAPVEAR